MRYFCLLLWGSLVLSVDAVPRKHTTSPSFSTSTPLSKLPVEVLANLHKAPASACKISHHHITTTTHASTTTTSASSTTSKYPERIAADEVCPQILNSSSDGQGTDNLRELWNTTSMQRTFATLLMENDYNTSVPLWLAEQIFKNTPDKISMDEECGVGNCKPPEGITFDDCSEPGVALPMTWQYIWLRACFENFADYVGKIDTKALSPALTGASAQIPKLVDTLDPNANQDANLKDIRGQINQDEVFDMVFAVLGTILDNWAPEGSGLAEIFTSGDSLEIDEELDVAIQNIEDVDHLKDQLQSKLAKAADHVMSQIDDLAAIPLQHIPQNTKEYPYNSQQMNAIDLFDNGKFAAPFPDEFYTKAKDRAEAMFLGAIAAYVWSMYDVVVATATGTLADQDRTISKQACDLNLTGSEFHQFCVDGRAFFIYMDTEEAYTDVASYGTAPGVDDFEDITGVPMEGALKSALNLYNHYGYNSTFTQATSAVMWFNPSTYTSDTQWNSPFTICDFDQIIRPRLDLKGSGMEDPVLVRGYARFCQSTVDLHGTKFPVRV